MDLSNSSYTMSVILEEKVSDLENKLSNLNQTLRTKENVLQIQQDQIKKMEGMYKKCLDDIANVTCEHKKTLNDLENLRIILKSYEYRQSNCSDFGCQVELKLSEVKSECSQQLVELSDLILQQNEKTDYIINLMSILDGSSNKYEYIQGSIEDLQRVTRSLLETSEHRTLQSISQYPSLVPMIKSNIYQYKRLSSSSELETKILSSVDCMTQTQTEVKDSGINLPESVSLCSTQTDLSFMSTKAVNTELSQKEHKFTTCENTTLDQAVHTSIFKEIDRFNTELSILWKQIPTFESLLKRHHIMLREFDKLLTFAMDKDEESSEYRTRTIQLEAIIGRASMLTISEVKDLCKEITLRTTEECRYSFIEINSMREEIEMLKEENKELTLHHCNVPRTVVELHNQSTQTINNIPDGNRRLQDRLRKAVQNIKFLEDQLRIQQQNACTLEELKSLTIKMNVETAELHKNQLIELQSKHAGELESLCLQFNEQIESISSQQTKTRTIALQTTFYETIVEEIDTLRKENDKLIKTIQQLKHEVDCERGNKEIIEELKQMCINLGQNVNEVNTVTKENSKLKQQLDDTIKSGHEEFEKLQETYCDAIAKAREEVYALRQENDELKANVAELKKSLELSKMNALRSEADSDTHIESNIKSVSRAVSEIRLSSTHELADLKLLCKDISERLYTRNENSHDINERLDLLTNLENDIRQLMKEFADFKWNSRMEAQRLLLKHAELVAQNEELVNCLNQYKNVNESLLQSYYTLEKAKNQADAEHKEILNQSRRLEDELNMKRQKHKRDAEINTSGKWEDVRVLRQDNFRIHDQNQALEKELDDLRNQLQETRGLLAKARETKICEQCASAVKALQNLNMDYRQVRNEHTTLSNLLKDRENQLAEMRMKLSRAEEESLKSSDEMRKEITMIHRQLQLIISEKEELTNELRIVRSDYKRLLDESGEVKEKNSSTSRKLQEEITFLQNSLGKVSSIKEKNKLLEKEVDGLNEKIKEQESIIQNNENITQNYRAMEAQLNKVHELKKNLEDEFDDYIRTNNIVNSSLAKQNENMDLELCTLKKENEELEDQLKEMHHTQNKSRTELVRVIDECKCYKAQLEDMARRIDFHLQEHLAYKKEVEMVKGQLQAEITSLKEMLQCQHMHADVLESLCADGANSERRVQDLKNFINTKELEIDFLMDQKLKAMEAIGKCYNKSCLKKKNSGEGENSSLKNTLKRSFTKATSIDTMASQYPSYQGRSLSLPRSRICRGNPNSSEKEHKRIPPVKTSPDLLVKQLGRMSLTKKK